MQDGEWKLSQPLEVNDCPSFMANNGSPLCVKCGRPHSVSVVHAWGIFFDTLEAPGKFLLRLFRFERGRLQHFTKPDFVETLEEARAKVAPGCVKLDKTPYRLNVVEVWA